MLTIAITAATPMMIPSMVKAARILLRTRARNATRMIISKFILLLVVFVVDRWQILQFFRCVASMLDRTVRLDFSILKNDHAVGVFRDVRLVRDQHERDSSLTIQTLKDLHHFNRRSR